MNKQYVPHKPGEPIQENSDGITIKGHVGSWYVVNTAFYGRQLFELEHEKYGDEAAHLIVDCHGNIILDGVWNGFDDYYDSVSQG